MGETDRIVQQPRTSNSRACPTPRSQAHKGAGMGVSTEIQEKRVPLPSGDGHRQPRQPARRKPEE